MKQLFLLLFGIFSLLFVSTQLPAVSAAHGEPVWARFQSGELESDYYGVASDSAGNTYVVGDIDGPGIADFGNGVTLELTTNDWCALIVKYDPNGNALWAKTIDSPGQGSDYLDVAVSPDGQFIYAVGSLHRNYSSDFGNGVIVSGSYAYGNPVLVKYDASGNALWARTTTSSSYSSRFGSVSTSSDNRVVVSGDFYTGYVFGFGNGVSILSSGGGGQYGVIMYDENGTPQWGRTVLSSMYNVISHDLHHTPSGDTIVVGRQVGGGVTDLGNGVQINSPSTPAGQAFIAKYDATGTPQWASSVVNGLSSTFYGVDTDSEGNLYVSGDVDGYNLLDLGNGVQLNPPPDGTGGVPLVAKYSSGGIAQWATSVEIMDYMYASLYDLKVFGEYLYAVGFANEGAINFGNSVIVNFPATSGGNIVLAVYSKSTGTPLFVKTAESSSYEGYLESLTVDGAGNLYSVGYFESATPINFGAGVLGSPSDLGWHGGVLKFQGYVVPPTPTPSATPIPTIKPVTYSPSAEVFTPTPSVTPSIVVVTPTPSVETTPVLKKTIEVVDALGNPIKNTEVTIDGVVYSTDSQGLVTVNLTHTFSNVSVFNKGKTVLGAYENGKIIIQTGDSSTSSKSSTMVYLFLILLLVLILVMRIILRKK